MQPTTSQPKLEKPDWRDIGDTSAIKTLAELNCMDLYLNLGDPSVCRYRPAARQAAVLGNRALPAQLMPEVADLIVQVKERLASPEGAFSYNGMRYRVAINNMANGETWAALRRVAPQVPTLEQLSFAPHIINHLRNLGRRDGLVLISGATGHGKTTTAFALLADFLRRYGGVGMTIEDPVEYLLEGQISDTAYCYQVQVDTDDGWAASIKRALRWTPRFVLVGEIRTGRAAEQVLRAATTGHLVISTVHAGTIEESLLGLSHLAEQVMGNSSKYILAASITAAINQSLGASGPYLRYIFTEENNAGDPVRALIRDSKIGMINSYIDKQIARVLAAQQAATAVKR